MTVAEATRMPKLLDLFCCAGGAAKGYQRAGFYVVGIDIEDQPNYAGDEFWKADAIDILIAMTRGWYDNIAAVHASPPCQAHSDLQKQSKREYPDFIEPARELLTKIGKPYVIENVEGAPLINPTMLCGTQFPDLRVIRHRLFETNFDVPDRGPHPKHPLVFTHDKRKGHHGKLDQDYSFVQVTGGGNCSMKNARDAMHCEWMQTKHELNEAIPPAYTEWIGYWLRGEVERRKAAA